MARRNLSTKDIKEGVSYIYSKLEGEKLSAREVSEDKNLPFSMTTYYKYLPKYEKSLKKSLNNEGVLDISTVTQEAIDDDRTPTKAIAANKKNLEAVNKELLEENNMMARFIVKKYIASEELNTGRKDSENDSTSTGIH